mgnify:CR=1 FL=1
MATVNIQEAKTHLSGLVERPDIIFGAYAGEVAIDDALFTRADAEVAALFDADLGVEP